MNIKEAKFAIIHDWFLRKSFGGAEKVTFTFDKLLRENYSIPDIFSITSNIIDFQKNFINERRIQTSLIQSLPYGKTHVQNYLPILPFAIEQIDLSKYEIIISSSHAFAKGVITSPNQLHISYVHTPMRYAYDQMNTYLGKIKFANFGVNLPIRYLLYKLRQWDFYSSQRIDYLIANSSFTAKRIKKYWGLESEVIHPPVEIQRFKYNETREDFYLSVNRLVPNKRIDLLVKAFNKLRLPLVIIGDGPEKSKLENIAESNIKFLGKISDLDVERYMSRCRAFVYAGVEDFGIAPIEAIASGSPVIAFGKGGILDTVNCLSNKNKTKISTGLLFKKQTPEDVFDTISWFEDKKIWTQFDSETLHNYAKSFSPKDFNTKFEKSINNAWDKFKKTF